VSDAALLFNAIARPDVRDWHALPADDRDWTKEIESGVAGLKIAFSPTLGYGEVDPEIATSVASSVTLFSELGAHVEEIDPGFADPQPTFETLWSAAAARLTFGLPEHERKLVESGLQAVAERGRTIAVIDYLLAAEAREALGRKLDIFHQEWDLLITPTNAAPPDFAEAPPGGRRPSRSPFAFPFNLTQQPAISVTSGLTLGGLPIGLQIVGPKYADGLVLRAARAFERARPFPVLKEPA
jgi:aspartyl-tRNA(Asn)/glutamyl-tRNA(Gln) amidotransferase subunit A